MVEFQPSGVDYEGRVRESFTRQIVMQTIGARLVRVEPGIVEIDLPFRADLTQQHGFLHAGIVATVLDSACGYAAFSLMPADAAVLSIEFKVNLLSPAKGEFLRAHGEVKRAGRNITVCTADALVFEEGGSKVVATMLATMMCIRDGKSLAG